MSRAVLAKNGDERLEFAKAQRGEMPPSLSHAPFTGVHLPVRRPRRARGAEGGHLYFDRCTVVEPPNQLEQPVEASCTSSSEALAPTLL